MASCLDRCDRPAVLTRRRLGILALALALLGASCSPRGSEPESETPGGSSSSAEARPESILLVTIDTARRDAFGCYGGSVPTPVFDAVARDGVIFRHAVTSVPVTHPSHTTLMTGLYPYRHGVRDNGLYRLGDEAVTLAEIFKKNGWRTAAFVSVLVLDDRCGLAQGFDLYDDALRSVKGVLNWRERPGNATVDRAIAYLEKTPREDPLFMWVHLFDPHAPFAPPEPFASRYQGRPYDGEIAFVDQQIGRLLASFRKTRTSRVVVVTSDHGEALNDREPTHGLLLYQPTVAVPLVMAGVGLPHGVESDTLVGLVDLFPALLRIAGIDHDGPTDAYDPLARLDGSPRPEPVVLETQLPRLSFGWSSLYGLVDGRTKYIIGSEESELYQLDEDPGEAHNLAEEQMDPVRNLSAQLESILKRPPVYKVHRITLEGSTRQALESLGYVSGPAPDEGTDLGLAGPAPRRMAGLLGAYGHCEDQIAAGDYEEAYRGLVKILAKDPNNPMFRQSLGRVLTLMQRFEEAKRELEKVLALRPDRPGVSLHIGLCDEGLGDDAAAERAYRATLEVSPHHAPAHFRLAGLLWRTGRKDEARALYRAFIRLNPPNEKETALARERLAEETPR